MRNCLIKKASANYIYLYLSIYVLFYIRSCFIRLIHKGQSFLKRANTAKLREVFLKYASYKKNGEYFMTSEDFVRKFLGLFTDVAFNDVS